MMWAAVVAAVAGAVGDSGAVLEKGALSARGVAAADLRSPSAEIARVKAERSARDRAHKKLAAALGKLRPQLAVAARERLADHATTGDIRYGSDGSVELTLRLVLPPVDAVEPRPSANPDAAAVEDTEGDPR